MGSLASHGRRSGRLCCRRPGRLRPLRCAGAGEKGNTETVLLDLTVAPVRSDDGAVRWLLAEARDVMETGGRRCSRCAARVADERYASATARRLHASRSIRWSSLSGCWTRARCWNQPGGARCGDQPLRCRGGPSGLRSGGRFQKNFVSGSSAAAGRVRAVDTEDYSRASEGDDRD